MGHCVHRAVTVGPENKATVLLITHLQRSDTCRKPGTAFTMEYQMPGTDVRTHTTIHNLQTLELP
eukprot:4726311-Amphidinium_carterae.1